MANISVRFDIDVDLDASAISEMLNSPRGMVGQFIMDLARKTEDEARARAPVKSGRLRRSIMIEQGVPGAINGADVIANTDYAYVVHEGRAGSLTITPKSGKVLRFPSKTGGGMVFAPSVTLGPQEAQPFLWNALRAVVARSA